MHEVLAMNINVFWPMGLRAFWRVFDACDFWKADMSSLVNFCIKFKY